MLMETITLGNLTTYCCRMLCAGGWPETMFSQWCAIPFNILSSRPDLPFSSSLMRGQRHMFQVPSSWEKDKCSGKNHYHSPPPRPSTQQQQISISVENIEGLRAFPVMLNIFSPVSSFQKYKTKMTFDGGRR